MNELIMGRKIMVKFPVENCNKLTAYLKGEPVVLASTDGWYTISFGYGDGVFVTLY